MNNTYLAQPAGFPLCSLSAFETPRSGRIPEAQRLLGTPLPPLSLRAITCRPATITRVIGGETRGRERKFCRSKHFHYKTSRLDTQIASDFKSNPLAIWNCSDLKLLRLQLRFLCYFSTDLDSRGDLTAILWSALRFEIAALLSRFEIIVTAILWFGCLRFRGCASAGGAALTFLNMAQKNTRKELQQQSPVESTIPYKHPDLTLWIGQNLDLGHLLDSQTWKSISLSFEP